LRDRFGAANIYELRKVDGKPDLNWSLRFADTSG
jgi:hypothetical protein